MSKEAHTVKPTRAMSKFEIDDPELRRILRDKTGHVRLIHDYQYETAYEIFYYLQSQLKAHPKLLDSFQPYMDLFDQFFTYSALDYDPKSTSYLDGLVMNMGSVLSEERLNNEQKARILIACGNLFELNRMLIDFANLMHREA
jgi:hypothetical protein